MPEDRRFELSEEDLNILANLAKMCNEVAKECCKVIRFSLDNTHDKYKEHENTTRKRLSTELGQLNCLMHIVSRMKLVDPDLFAKGSDQKYKALKRIPYNIVKVVPRYSPYFDSTKPTPDAMLNHKF